MDHLQRYNAQVRNQVLALLIFGNLIIIAGLWVGFKVLNLNDLVLLAVLSILALFWSIVFAYIIGNQVSKPVGLLWQAILHVSPEHNSTPPPNLEKLKLGRELVTSLSMQVYQLATAGGASKSVPAEDNRAKVIVSSLPLPMIVFDRDQNIVFANEAALKYLQRSEADVIGKNAYSVLDFSFPSEHTFDKWLSEARTNKVTDTTSWERVRLNLPEAKAPLQFDMAAYYNKNNPSGVEVIITMFDHTARYGEDDDSISFIALTVHELRTPLTLLQGYIEIFEDELTGKLDQELSSYLAKMQAASQQLTAFVDNILNVARVEADQLTLQLHEERWEDIIKNVASDLNLRAQVQGKIIECIIPPGLPAIAADRVSIYEVLSNLLDNAIKYSAQSQKIIVRAALGKDGLVETTVQDFGVGIPANVLPNLFEKFYRNFKTKTHVGGTGLGLYLCKSIIAAHGGNIWVTSKEGQGTTFGFTLKPYHMLAEELKTSDNKDIVRSAHGWIKNHSLYRR